MKRFLPVIIIFILIQGCNSGIPKGIIQPDKMEKVLFDVHVVDGYISTINNQDTSKIIASSYYNGIYKKYGIDSVLYNKSMDYYYSHPVVLNEIYTKVEKSFTLENAKYDKKISDDEKLKIAVNTSLLVIANLPITGSGFKMDLNPFDFNLSLSRF